MENVAEKDHLVLVAYVPDRLGKEWTDLRNYILDCLKIGVLVLDKSITLETMRFPQLGGVAIRDDQSLLFSEAGTVLKTVSNLDTNQEKESGFRAHDLKQSQTAVTTSLNLKSVKYAGKAGEEKQKIYERLVLYRQQNGLGCWAKLAENVRGGVVTEGMLRSMHLGELSPSINDWRAVGKALDKLGVTLETTGVADG